MLPTKQILISDTQWKELQKDIESDEFVDANLWYEGKIEPIKLRYRGGHTRDYPKKSFEILHRSKTTHLNAEYDDPSRLRNALSFKFFQWIGVPSPDTEHCLLELNGQNLGIYLAIEGVDALFFKRRAIDCKTLIYAENDKADFYLIDPYTQKPKSTLFKGYNLIIGTQEDRERFKSFIYNINTLKGHSLTKYLTENLDIDNYLHWLAGAVYTGNIDAFYHNYAVFQSKQNNRYQMTPWDYEGTWGRDPYGIRCPSDLVSVKGLNLLTRKILARKKFRDRYKEILIEILESVFNEERIGAEVDRMYQLVAPYISHDYTRKWLPSDFAGEPEVIRTYIKERRIIISNALLTL